MSAPPPPAILDRIRKLLAKTEANGCTPEEAALAASLAQRLMDRHHLAEVDLAVPAEEIGTQGPISNGTVRNGTWRAALAAALARSVGCRLLWISGASTVLVGRRTDAEIARYLFMALSRAVDTMAEAGWRVALAARPIPASAQRSMVARWKSSFRWGAVHTIEARLEKARLETTGEIPPEKALVLVSRKKAVDDWVEERLKPKKCASKRATEIDRAGYVAGAVAASSIDLTPKPDAARLADGSAR